MQLDTINVLERIQFLVPFSRFGDYPRETLHALTGPHGDLFEYWGHAVALLPMAHYRCSVGAWRRRAPSATVPYTPRGASNSAGSTRDTSRPSSPRSARA